MDKKNVITAIAATLTGSAIGVGATLFITNKKSEKKVVKPHKTTKTAEKKVESKNTTTSSTTQK